MTTRAFKRIFDSAAQVGMSTPSEDEILKRVVWLNVLTSIDFTDVLHQRVSADEIIKVTDFFVGSKESVDDSDATRDDIIDTFFLNGSFLNFMAKKMRVTIVKQLAMLSASWLKKHFKEEFKGADHFNQWVEYRIRELLVLLWFVSTGMLTSSEAFSDLDLLLQTLDQHTAKKEGDKGSPCFDSTSFGSYMTDKENQAFFRTFFENNEGLKHGNAVVKFVSDKKSESFSFWVLTDVVCLCFFDYSGGLTQDFVLSFYDNYGLVFESPETRTICLSVDPTIMTDRVLGTLRLKPEQRQNAREIALKNYENGLKEIEEFQEEEKKKTKTKKRKAKVQAKKSSKSKKISKKETTSEKKKETKKRKEFSETDIEQSFLEDVPEKAVKRQKPTTSKTEKNSEESLQLSEESVKLLKKNDKKLSKRLPASTKLISPPKPTTAREALEWDESKFKDAGKQTFKKTEKPTLKKSKQTTKAKTSVKKPSKEDLSVKEPSNLQEFWDFKVSEMGLKNAQKKYGRAWKNSVSLSTEFSSYQSQHREVLELVKKNQIVLGPAEEQVQAPKEADLDEDLTQPELLLSDMSSDSYDEELVESDPKYVRQAEEIPEEVPKIPVSEFFARGGAMYMEQLTRISDQLGKLWATTYARIPAEELKEALQRNQKRTIGLKVTSLDDQVFTVDEDGCFYVEATIEKFLHYLQESTDQLIEENRRIAQGAENLIASAQDPASAPTINLISSPLAEAEPEVYELPVVRSIKPQQEEDLDVSEENSESESTESHAEETEEKVSMEKEAVKEPVVSVESTYAVASKFIEDNPIVNKIPIGVSEDYLDTSVESLVAEEKPSTVSTDKDKEFVTQGLEEFSKVIDKKAIESDSEDDSEREEAIAEPSTDTEESIDETANPSPDQAKTFLEEGLKDLHESLDKQVTESDPQESKPVATAEKTEPISEQEKKFVRESLGNLFKEQEQPLQEIEQENESDLQEDKEHESKKEFVQEKNEEVRSMQTVPAEEEIPKDQESETSKK